MRLISVEPEQAPIDLSDIHTVVALGTDRSAIKGMLRGEKKNAELSYGGTVSGGFNVSEFLGSTRRMEVVGG